MLSLGCFRDPALDITDSMCKSPLLVSSALVIFAHLLGVDGLAQTPAQTPPPRSNASAQLATETQKIEEQIAKIGVGSDVTIVRRDGQEFYGSIGNIDSDSVFIRDVELKANVEINYQQIKKVSKGYGNSRALNGKRIPPKRHLIGLIVLGGLLATLLILVGTAKD